MSWGPRAEGLSHCSELEVEAGGQSIQSLSFFKCKKLRPERGRCLLASCPCPLGAPRVQESVGNNEAKKA